MQTRFLALVVTFVLSSSVWALDLRTTLEVGVTASQEIQQAKSKKKESQAVAWQYKSEIFPEVNARASAEKRLNSNAARAFTSGSTVNDPFSTYVVALDFRQPIFAGLALVSGWQLSNVVDEKSESEYFQTQQAVIKNLISAFYTYSQSFEIVEASKQNLKTLEDYSKTLTYYAKIGRGREMDRLQAGVNASLAAVDLQAAEQELLAAELNLKKLLQWSSKDPIIVTKSLHVSNHEKLKTQELTKATVDDLITRAFKENPRLQVLEKSVRESELSSDVEISPDRPSLDIVGTYGSQAIHRDDLLQNNAEFYSYGLSLRIPLFSGLSSLGKRRELRERTYQFEKSYEIEKRDMRVKIELAQKNLKKLFTQYQNLKDVAQRSQRALELVNRSYRQGTSSSQDVVSFQRSRYEADRALIQNQYSYLMALVELQDLIGIDLYKTYTQDL